MKQKDIKPDDFDKVLKKMEAFQVIERKNLMGTRIIYIDSSVVQGVKGVMREIECPDCEKPGIHLIQKRKCSFCNKEFGIDNP